MLLSNDNIYCGVFDSSIMRKNLTKSPNREVQCFEIELFHGDKGISYVNGNKYPTQRGMLLCVKPRAIRHSDFPVCCSFIRFFPQNNTDLDILEIIQSFPECTYINNFEKIEELAALFSRLGACFANFNNTLSERTKITALFLEILYRINRICKNESDSIKTKEIPRIAREAYEYINENFTKKCTLQSIANAVNISPHHLHTVFTDSLGLTPYEYVLQKRINLAQKLIAAGEKNMIEIALETGFCSQSHFNKSFKSQTGKTPAEYRKELISQYV